MQQSCPLCKNSDITSYHQDDKRSYLFCGNCHLVFVPEEFHLDEIEEKRIYDLHENDPYDPGYRRFLSRLFNPLAELIGENRKGLDFGCGPGPALATMFEERGHVMSLYDIYYYSDKDVLQEQYDFICATEVLEHLRSPDKEINRLYNMLNDEGWLALMTKLVIDNGAFSKWHYIQDRTHICFYGKETFQYLAELYNCELRFIGKDVIFLQKRG